ncbi:hypothetical protein O0L34_g17828 [Tuta absoluta]|nr:hypothetical protein O0L34_g17828 [Tuta absoluta]
MAETSYEQICASCLGATDVTQTITCQISSCNRTYHLNPICMGGVLKLDAEVSTWVFPHCTASVRKVGDYSSSPVGKYKLTPTEIKNVTIKRGKQSSTAIDLNETVELDGKPPANPNADISLGTIEPCKSLGGNGSLTAGDIIEIIRSELADAQRKLEIKFTKLIKDLTTEFNKEIEALKKSQEFISNEYESMKKKFAETENLHKRTTEEKTELNNTILNLNSRLSVMEQHSRNSNIELQCLPERKSENLINVVVQISKSTGSNISEGLIHHCTRVAKFNNESSRPRSVVVQFASPRVRDTFYAAVLKFNKKSKTIDKKLNTSHAGITGEVHLIYVVEHLTPTLKKLHAATRIHAKKLGYKHLLVRNGRVIVRATDTSDYIVIRDTSILDTLKLIEKTNTQPQTKKK